MSYLSAHAVGSETVMSFCHVAELRIMLGTEYKSIQKEFLTAHKIPLDVYCDVSSIVHVAALLAVEAQSAVHSIIYVCLCQKV